MPKNDLGSYLRRLKNLDCLSNENELFLQRRKSKVMKSHLYLNPKRKKAKRKRKNIRRKRNTRKRRKIAEKSESVFKIVIRFVFLLFLKSVSTRRTVSMLIYHLL